ncbi:MAG: hypothetical protein IJ598_01185 [Ruminococcus sp.]|nr:hypothetical protein [Ruminococcus sp.]
MENQANSAAPEKTGIEKAKELFEYEMTEVLLNFRQEAASMKGTPSAEYLGMEVPSAGVAYAPAELTVEGIGYQQPDTAVALDTAAIQTDLPPVCVAVPETAAVELSTEATVEIDDSAFVAAAVPAVAPVTLPAAQPPAVAVAVPEVRADADFTVPPAKAPTAVPVSVPPAVQAQYDFGAAPAVSATVGVAAAEAVVLPPLPKAAQPTLAVAVEEIQAPAVPTPAPVRPAELPPMHIPEASAVSLTLDAPPTTFAQPTLPDIPEKPDTAAECAAITDLLRKELA